jgi:hypothetical protein
MLLRFWKLTEPRPGFEFNVGGRVLRPRVAAVLAVLLVAGVVGGVLLAVRSGGPEAGATGRSQQSLNDADKRRLEQTLSSSDPSVAGAALAPAVREAIGRRAAGLVPGGLVIDGGTFKMATSSLATVEGRPRAGNRNTFLLMLEREHGRWLLYATRALS